LKADWSAARPARGIRLIRTIIRAENRNVAASKKNAVDVGWLARVSPNGTHPGMCEAVRRSAPNAPAASGIEPNDDARISPFASSS
jgi:hypothetical protein